MNWRSVIYLKLTQLCKLTILQEKIKQKWIVEFLGKKMTYSTLHFWGWSLRLLVDWRRKRVKAEKPLGRPLRSPKRTDVAVWLGGRGPWWRWRDVSVFKENSGYRKINLSEKWVLRAKWGRCLKWYNWVNLMLFSKREKARRKNRWERRPGGKIDWGVRCMVGWGIGFQCLDGHLGNNPVGSKSKQ